MKTYANLRPAMLILALWLAACSKSGSDSVAPPPGPPPRDLEKELFENRLWTGTFVQSTVDIPNPYSMQFTTGDSVILRVSFNGVNRGTYTLQQNKLTLNFYNLTVFATVSDADTLKDITVPQWQGFRFLNSKPCAHAEQVLDNTRWIGINPYTVNMDTLILDFKPGGQVRANNIHQAPYTREAGRINFEYSGYGLYGDAKYFFIHMPDNTMIGQSDFFGVGNRYFILKKQ